MPLLNELRVICVYAAFEVDPTTTASLVVLNGIPNGFNPFTTFVINAACVLAEKIQCSIKYRALTDAYLSEVFNDPFHKTKNKQDCSTQEDCCRESERVDKEWTRQHTVICRASVHPSLKPLANLWLLYFNWPKLAKARTSLHCQFLSDSLS